jgi:hypothetical protein
MLTRTIDWLRSNTITACGAFYALCAAIMLACLAASILRGASSEPPRTAEPATPPSPTR